MQALPNLLIIGSAKCATSSLHYYLNEHPDVAMSRKKECHYFCHQDIDEQLYEPRYRPIETLEEYSGFFEGFEDLAVRGESSPMYLYYTESARRIAELIPDCTLVAVLRNPARRAFSAYTHAVRDELEPLSFREAVNCETHRMESGKFTPLQAYVDCGMYANKLAPFFERFGREQIKILLYEDLQDQMELKLKELCQLLKIDDTFQFNIQPKLNRSGVPKRRWLHRLTQAAARDHSIFRIIKKPFTNHSWVRTVKGIEYWNYQRLRMSDEDHDWMLAKFTEDMSNLSDLLGRDMFKVWRTKRTES